MQCYHAPMARRTRDPRPAGAAGTVAEQLAEGLAGTGGPLRQHVADGLRDLGAVDLAVYSAVADTPTPSLDEPLRRLSNAANNSGLWFAIAAALALAGGSAGRRAALRGTLAIGATSALVNLAVKSIWARQRPDRAGVGVPVWRNVRMPASTSFPSGHAASWSARSSARAPGRPWPAWWTGCSLLETAPRRAAISSVSSRRVPRTRTPRMLRMQKVRQANPVPGHSACALTEPASVADQLKRTRCSAVYIHLDLDVLDPAVFPYTSRGTGQLRRSRAGLILRLRAASRALTALRECRAPRLGGPRRAYYLAGACAGPGGIQHGGGRDGVPGVYRHRLGAADGGGEGGVEQVPGPETPSCRPHQARLFPNDRTGRRSRDARNPAPDYRRRARLGMASRRRSTWASPTGGLEDRPLAAAWRDSGPRGPGRGAGRRAAQDAFPRACSGRSTVGAAGRGTRGSP